jgi:glucose/arabinose dehydrogenase
MTIAVRPLGLVIAALAFAIGCSATSRLPEIQGFGPDPVLPPPDTSLIPITDVVKAIGWRPDAAPTAATGARVVAFARGLDHPRWLYVLPNGDVLVAETNGPPGAGAVSGIRRWFYNRYQQKSGNAGPSANRITLLRDADGDGVAETRVPFLTGLSSPLGMALIGETLYIANHDGVVRVPYTSGATQITVRPVKVFDLPSQPPEHHWTKNILASPDGRTLYAAVGSNSNVAEEGLDKEEGRAAIWALDLAGGTSRVFASGLRNPVGMAWVDETGQLWTAVNERDEIGNDLVPDYLTSVREGAFYGWPYSYYGRHVDERVKPQRPDLVATAIVPDYALGSHTASLGLVYSRSNTLPVRFQHGMFVGQHGSWNRKPRSGFKVIFVPFSGGRPSGLPLDVLSGFVTADGDAMGRPVGVALDTRGGLLVADDVGKTVWRVAGADAK